MRRFRKRGLPRSIGPAAVAIVGLAAIAVGAAIKSGYVRIGPGGAVADSGASSESGLTLRPDSSERVLPGRATPPAPARTATPRAGTGEVALPPLAADTVPVPAGMADSNAVRPTPSELAELASQLIVPVAGVQPKDLIDSFNEARGSRTHNALDIPAPRGTPVLAASDGRILRLFTSDAGGLMIYAADPSARFVLMYAHLDRYADGVTEGMPVRRGETIGYVGTTGNAPPNLPHLHFGIARTRDVANWWTGFPVDPFPLLRR